MKKTTKTGILQMIYSFLLVAATFGQTSSQDVPGTGFKSFLCRDDESFKFRDDSEKDCYNWASKKNKNKQRCQLTSLSHTGWRQGSKGVQVLLQHV